VSKVNGKRILVVEDEALLALDLRFALEDLGASVVGPCYRLATALSTAELGGIDAAVLDVDLAGETVFPVADLLRKADVPFVFHTGRLNPQTLAEIYQDAPVCPKPTDPETVARTLFALLEKRQATH
jgi:CheY-like chemotaxis protein